MKEEKEGALEELEDSSAPICIQVNYIQCWLWVWKGIIGHHSDKVWCTARFTYLQQLVEKAHQSKLQKSFEKIVPKQYRDFIKVFTEQELEHLPMHKVWDHAIDLVPGL